MIKFKVLLIAFVSWCFVRETTETLLNVALRKSVIMKSPYRNDPVRAVDGNPNICTETFLINYPFWEVDLNDTFVVESIVVYNRRDCCAERLHDLIFSGSNDNTRYTTFGFHKGQVPMIFTLYPDSPMKVRWVRLSMQGKQRLTLCEVEVMTRTHVNVALQKATIQSMPYQAPSYRAVDGNKGNDQIKDQSCAETLDVTDPFWEVDVNDNFIVESIIVYNRGDCCTETLHDVLFSVSNDHTRYETFSFHTGEVPQMLTLTPESPMVAQWVRISMQGSNRRVTLCEVEVMSNTLIKKNYFKPMQTAQGNESIIQSLQVKSPMQCLYICSKTLACFSIKVGDTSTTTAHLECTLLKSLTYNASIGTNVHFYTRATVSLIN